ncbi:large with 2 MYB domains plus low complexity GA repeat and Q repeat at the C-terminus [Cryptosporidium xiaoi]|uniref:Large with 2 MYB domains plus low complexity GA repeat and Q repeat at the C-terminus n=1 Tax=Cryptosporidium xiaoi TaxID=659607 RepID=A0AAV9Y5Z3_9CRYT
MSGLVSIDNINRLNNMDEDEVLLRNILDYSVHDKSSGRSNIEKLMEEYVNKIRVLSEKEMQFFNYNMDKFLDSEQNIFEDCDQSKLVFNNEWSTGNMGEQKYNSVLRIQDEISRISLELNELKKEQERRVSILNFNDHSVTTTSILEDDIDDTVDCDEIVGDSLEFDGVSVPINVNVGNSISSTGSSVGNKELKVVKKKKTNRRYFRRKNTNNKEKNDLDEMEKLVRSRTPLDIITLASKYYLRKLKFNRDAKFNDLTLPIAQEYRRGPYINIGEKNIRDIRSVNMMNSSTLGSNFSFLDDLSKCCRVSSITFVSRSSDKVLGDVLSGIPYENSIRGITNVDGGLNWSFGVGIPGIEFVTDDHVTRRNEDDGFFDNFAQAKELEPNNEDRTNSGLEVLFETYRRKDENQINIELTKENTYGNNAPIHSVMDNIDTLANKDNNYSYLASVMENESKVFAIARQRVKIRVHPGRNKELEELSKCESPEELKKIGLKFVDSLRDCIKDDKVKNREETRKDNKKKENEFGISDCLDLLRKEDEEKLYSLNRLKNIIKEFNEKDATNSQLSFFIPTYNYLVEETELLSEILRDKKDDKLIKIYRDDIITNGEIQDYYEIILSIPESIYLMPYYTSLCYPLEDTVTKTIDFDSKKNSMLDAIKKNLKPINGSFYHPLNLFGVPNRIKKVRRHIGRRKLFIKNELLNLKRFLPSVYSYYREYVRNTEIQNSERSREFTWGCLPVRAIDHPDQIVPLPIGYFKHNFRFKAYHKFLDLLPLYRKNDGEKTLRMSFSNLLFPISFRNSSRVFVSIFKNNKNYDNNTNSLGVTGFEDGIGRSVIRKIENESANIENRICEEEHNLMGVNLKRRRGLTGSGSISNTKRTKESSIDTQSSFGVNDDGGFLGSVRIGPHIQDKVTSIGITAPHNPVDTSRGVISGVGSGGGSLGSKEKELNVNIMKNREKEKEIVHQKQVQREWMQMTTSSSSLIGPSPLWFENCIFKFPSDIEYSIMDRDPILFSGSLNPIVFTNNNNKMLNVIEESDRNLNTIWSHSEIRLFIEKYLMYPKDFRRISSFMEHKSIKDCIDFYYKYKYSLGLKRILGLVQYFKGQSKNQQNSSKFGSININDINVMNAINSYLSFPESDFKYEKANDSNDHYKEDSKLVEKKNTKSVFHKDNSLELCIWNSNVSTRKCIEIIYQKKQSYREYIIDEILKTLYTENLYDCSIKEVYNQCCFFSLKNMNFYSEKILTKSSLKRIIVRPHTIFRLPVLEGLNSMEISRLYECDSNKSDLISNYKRKERSWTIFDEIIYKSIFRIHNDGVYSNYNYLSEKTDSKYLMDNLSNGYILPRNIHSLISPVYGINIHNETNENTTSVPSNIPIIFQDYDFSNNQVLTNHIIEPRISSKDLRASIFLYMNQFVDSNDSTSNSMNKINNSSLFDSITISPGKNKQSKQVDHIFPSVNSTNENGINSIQPLLSNSDPNIQESYYNQSPSSKNKLVQMSNSNTQNYLEKTRQTKKKRGYMNYKDGNANNNNGLKDINFAENKQNLITGAEVDIGNTPKIESNIAISSEIGLGAEIEGTQTTEIGSFGVGVVGTNKILTQQFNGFPNPNINPTALVGIKHNNTNSGNYQSTVPSNIGIGLNSGLNTYNDLIDNNNNNTSYSYYNLNLQGNDILGTGGNSLTNNNSNINNSQTLGQIVQNQFGSRIHSASELGGIGGNMNNLKNNNVNKNSGNTGNIVTGGNNSIILGNLPVNINGNLMSTNQIQKIPLLLTNMVGATNNVGSNSITSNNIINNNKNINTTLNNNGIDSNLLSDQKIDSISGIVNAGSSKQNWNDILMNQYLQQQLMFQQTLQEQFKNAVSAGGSQAGLLDFNNKTDLTSSFSDYSLNNLEPNNNSTNLIQIGPNQNVGPTPSSCSTLNHLNTNIQSSNSMANPVNQLISGKIAGNVNPMQMHAQVTSLNVPHVKNDMQKETGESMLGVNRKYVDNSLISTGDLNNLVLNNNKANSSPENNIIGGVVADYPTINHGLNGSQMQPQAFQRNICQLQQMFQHQVLQQQILQNQIQSQIQNLNKNQIQALNHNQGQNQVQIQTQAQGQTQIQNKNSAQFQHLFQNQLVKGGPTHTFGQNQQIQNQVQNHIQLQLQNQIQAQIQAQIQNLIQTQIQISQLQGQSNSQNQTKNQNQLQQPITQTQSQPQALPQHQLQSQSQLPLPIQMQIQTMQPLVQTTLGGTGTGGGVSNDQLPFLYQHMGTRNSGDVAGILQQKQLQQLQQQQLQLQQLQQLQQQSLLIGNPPGNIGNDDGHDKFDGMMRGLNNIGLLASLSGSTTTANNLIEGAGSMDNINSAGLESLNIPNPLVFQREADKSPISVNMNRINIDSRLYKNRKTE